jgi:hypothetical protein
MAGMTSKMMPRMSGGFYDNCFATPWMSNSREDEVVEIGADIARQSVTSFMTADRISN